MGTDGLLHYSIIFGDGKKERGNTNMSKERRIWKGSGDSLESVNGLLGMDMLM